MSETRERLLIETNRLLAERSYSGFSYADLAARLGLRKPTIHYHFGRKEELVAEVVRAYAGGFERWTAAVDGAAPRAQLEAYFGLFEGFVQSGSGCPYGTLSADFSILPELVTDELHRLMGAHVAWLSGVLERGRERGELEFAGPAPQLARLVAASVQGAVLSARALGPRSYRQIVDQLSALLGAEPGPC